MDEDGASSAEGGGGLCEAVGQRVRRLVRFKGVCE